MKPSANAYNLAKESEGLRLTAYPDPATGGDPWTIGYGSTRGVKKGMTINLAEAQQRLVVDMTEAGNAVTRWVDVPLTQGQFDALCDFVFMGVLAIVANTVLELDARMAEAGI